jgi:hypothetical protein
MRMRQIVSVSVDEIMPTPDEVLETQGMTGRALPERILTILNSALDLFRKLAEPKGLMQEWPIADFPAVFSGNGAEFPESPVQLIVPPADALALFAATLGSALIAKSSELFTKGGAALGFMLDSVNSSGAERLGGLMGQRFIEQLPLELRRSKALKLQYYSPGNCNWDISSQEKLFRVLHPEEIGITLNARNVMQPFKSISGILVAGDIAIHRVAPDFPFCNHCKTHKCLKRQAILERDTGRTSHTN